MPNNAKKGPKSSFNNATRAEIAARLRRRESQSSIAAAFGVNRSTISRLARELDMSEPDADEKLTPLQRLQRANRLNWEALSENGSEPAAVPF
jgi:transposase-like protein